MNSRNNITLLIRLSLNTIIILIFSKNLLFAKENFTIKPAGELQLRYEDVRNKYTPLGQSLYNTKQTNYNDYVIGGTFGVQTLWDSYSFNALFYGTGRLHPKDENKLKNTKYFYNNTQDEFVYLGELSLKKEFGKHWLTIGRQEYDSSLVNKNYRITQNAYEGVSYEYKDEKFNLKTLYFHKSSSSTMANNVPTNHRYGFLGYGFGYNTSGYSKLSKHIINEDLSTNGAIHFLSSYKTENSLISYENLYVDNFFNTSKLVLGYSLKNLYFKTGVMYQTSVGKSHIENAIETSQNGKKLKAKHYQAQIKYQEGTLQLLYNISLTPSNKNSIYNGTLYSPFSNQVSWLVGLNTSHAIIADTLSQKIAAVKSTKIYNIPVVLVAAHIHYDIGKDNGLIADAISTSESYLHLKAQLTKNINAMLQYSYIDNYDPVSKNTYNTKMTLEYKF